jgi:hypothetical protein
MIGMFLPSMIQFYILVIFALLSYFITYFTVYHPVFRLSILNVFNRKPFSCWLCSNFWFSQFLWVNLAYIWTPFFLLWGEILTAMTTYIIWHDPMP